GHFGGLLGQLARSLAGALARSGEATGPQFVTLACSHGCAWLPVKRQGANLHEVLCFQHSPAPFASNGRTAHFYGPCCFFKRGVYALASTHASYAIPAIYEAREYAVAGALMSYAPTLAEAYPRVGVYPARTLKGPNPADLPVLQSTKFRFVINMKTAKVLGVKISDDLTDTLAPVWRSQGD